MQAAGSLNGTIQRPQLDLRFVIRVARATESTGGGFSPTKTWAYITGQIPAFITPLRDELYFLQSGTQNIAQVECFFHYGVDIKVSDRIVMLAPDNIAGIPGGWFEITERLAPVAILAHVRCYARATDNPGL